MGAKRPIDLILRSDFGMAELTEIARGGFKTVYRAKLKDGTTEALKVLKLPSVGTTSNENAFYQEALGRIQREIGIIGKCTVPELVRLGSVAPARIQTEQGEHVVYSEEFLDGIDLWREISQHGPVPTERELRVLFCALLAAIRQIWDLGFVHRDIKPHNVLHLNDPRRPFVLLDLGISFGVREAALTYNPEMRFVGTYRYMAPEMAQPDFRKDLDYRSDLYCAALTVYEYSSQFHPFARDADDLINTVSRSLRDPAAPLQSKREDLSDEFCELIDQMLKKKPSLRPSNLNMLISQMGKNQ